jgi:hypothetical protein
MAYQVDRFNGTFLVSVDDGTIDTTTDIRFLGKNYAGYGEVQNENFLHLMENFANTTPPPKVVSGQIWYDSSTKRLRFYDGARFRTASGAETGNTAPSGLAQGDFWFDTSTEQLYTWNGTSYILIGPQASPTTGEAAAVQATVKDNVGTNHSILKLISEGVVIAVISNEEFTLDSTNPITGFNSPKKIKKGVTLKDTNGTTGVTETEFYFWGTASNSAKLGGYSASDFVRSGSATLNNLAIKDAGITIGDGNDLKIWIDNGDEPIIQNQSGTTITLRIKNGSVDNDVAIITETGMYPGTTNFFQLGQLGSVWKSVMATNFYGTLGSETSTQTAFADTIGIHKGNIKAVDNTVAYNATAKTFSGSFSGNLTGNVIGDLTGTATAANSLLGFTPAEPATDSTIPVRTADGDIIANQFIGIGDKADRLKINTDDVVDSDPYYKSAKTMASANSIAARDSSGNITANVFNGTATAARYADLAEKYLCDAEYEPGTVVAIGGDAEVTACNWGQRAIGVVSTNPAFMMNKDLEGGTYIALKGRVPVKVTGSVKKGDCLIAGNDGAATTAEPHAQDIFAIALETNLNTDTKVIEAVVL